jgi:hypothetical protein
MGGAGSRRGDGRGDRARIAIVELRPDVTAHSTARETVEQEMTDAGFHLMKAFDYLERQFFLVFGVAR